jgi:hypothetical protein
MEVLTRRASVRDAFTPRRSARSGTRLRAAGSARVAAGGWDVGPYRGTGRIPTLRQHKRLYSMRSRQQRAK